MIRREDSPLGCSVETLASGTTERTPGQGHPRHREAANYPQSAVGSSGNAVLRGGRDWARVRPRDVRFVALTAFSASRRMMRYPFASGNPAG